MKKARRYLGLFLASVLSLSNIPAVNVLADSDVTSLKVSVVGRGTVILDDYESKYTLENGDVFNAKVTTDTKLKVSLDAKEGNTIEGVVVDGSLNSSIPKGSKSGSFDYSVPSSGGNIKITFAKDEVVVEPVVEETAPVKPIEETVEETAKEDEVKELSKTERILNEYLQGIYDSEESVSYRKELVEKHSLQDYVDESNFFKYEHLIDLIDLDTLGDTILLVNISKKDLALDFLQDEKIDPILLSYLKNVDSINTASSPLLSRVALQGKTGLYITNHGNITYYEGGILLGRGDMFSINGRTAFCADHRKLSPSTGTLVTSTRTESNSTIRKALYYGFEGPSQISGWDSNALRIATSVAVSHVRNGDGNSLSRRLINQLNGLPEPPSSFTAYIADTNGSAYQDLAFWMYNPTGSLQISKSSADESITSNNNYYSLEGAEYGVFTSSSATNQVGTLVIGSNGWSQEITLDAGTYYIKETRAPKGYALDRNIYPMTVTSGSKVTKAFKDRPQSDPVGILIRKVDSATGSSKPVDGASLADAHFTVKFYGGEYSDGVNPADLGIAPTRSWVVKTDSDGYTYLNDSYKVSGDPFYYLGNNVDPTLPLGTVTIQETKAPVGYKINHEVFVRKITANGDSSEVSTYVEPTVEEKSLDFTIRKVQQGTNTVLPNVTFRHTRPDGSSQELKTNSNGEIAIRGLNPGVHKIQETATIEGFLINTNEFVFEVTSDSTIRVISNTTNMGMSYSESDGNGILTVENGLRPFQIKVVKVNDKGTPLQGAEFTLYSDREGNNEIKKLVSNERGELIFEGLTVGTPYYFKETKAPAGYRIPVDANGNVHMYEVIVQSSPSNGVFNFTVDGVQYGSNSTNGDIHIEGTKDDRIVSIKVVNSITMKLPDTGSGMMIPMLMVGMALMFMALTVNKKSKKNKE